MEVYSCRKWVAVLLCASLAASFVPLNAVLASDGAGGQAAPGGPPGEAGSTAGGASAMPDPAAAATGTEASPLPLPVSVEGEGSGSPAEDGPLIAQAVYSPSAEIDSITSQIVKKELELLRLNTRYRIESTKPSKWKAWRQFVYNMAIFVTANVGISHVSYSRWHIWQRPARARMDYLLTGPTLLLISHAIGMGAVIIEKTLDTVGEVKLKKKGFDDKTCTQRAKALKTEIEELMARRERAIAALEDISQSDRNILLAESEVLKEIKDTALAEYSRFHIRANKFRAGRDMGYFAAFSQLATGGMIGSLLGILAATNRKPRLTGPGGIGFTVSGAIIVLSPFMTKGALAWAERRAKKKCAKELGPADKLAGERFDVARAKLQTLLSSASSGYVLDTVRRRAQIYDEENGLLDKHLAMSKAELKAANKQWWERALVSFSIGGTKMSWGIQLAHAGFAFHPRGASPLVRVPVRIGGATIRAPLPRTKPSASLFHWRVAQGATSYIPGTALGIFDTAQLRIRGELQDAKLKKAGIHPGQALKQRLQSIDKLEKMVP